MRKLFLAAFLAISTIKILTHSAYASDFTTSYITTYNISENAEISVNQKLTIKNLTNKIFASSYKFTVNHLRIYDIEAHDTKNTLKTDINSKENSTIITVFFNDQVIGENSELSWILKYKTKDIASRNGQILDVNIPKIASQGNITDYQIVLEVPHSFGPLMLMSPEPKITDSTASKKIYKFNLEELQNSSVSAAFGEYQLLNFKINYHIENKELLPSKKTIAFPPDIKDRQQLIIKSLSHKPESFDIDKDGNYIATYTLGPRTDLKIDLIGSVKVKSKKLDLNSGGKFKELPKELITTYTKEQKYWEVTNPKIAEIAKSLKDPNQNVSQNAFKIYQYVLKTLIYNTDKAKSLNVERLGAIMALNNPKDVICMEFVDIFVTIARNMGIPAREVNGYAYSKDASLAPLSINLRGGDILHAWAEYFDPNFGWVEIDPTWGETSGLDYFSKIDTNHIIFAIKGLSSEYPLPGGAYKLESDDKPQVDVSFAFDKEVSEKTNYKIRAYYDTSLNPLNLLTNKKKIVLVNEGNTTLFDINTQIEKLPPFNNQTISEVVKDNKIDLKFKDFNNNEQNITVSIEKIPYKRPIDITIIFPYLVILVLALLLYMIFYLLIVQKLSLQKLVRHLYRHPQDQGQ